MTRKRFSGKGKAKLTRGDLPGYFFWMSTFMSSLDMEADGYFTADSLNFALDFTVPIQGKMKVKYGRWTTTGVQTAVSAPADEAVYTLGGRRLEALPAPRRRLHRGRSQGGALNTRRVEGLRSVLTASASQRQNGTDSCKCRCRFLWFRARRQKEQKVKQARRGRKSAF